MYVCIYIYIMYMYIYIYGLLHIPHQHVWSFLVFSSVTCLRSIPQGSTQVPAISAAREQAGGIEESSLQSLGSYRKLDN